MSCHFRVLWRPPSQKDDRELLGEVDFVGHTTRHSGEGVVSSAGGCAYLHEALEVDGANDCQLLFTSVIDRDVHGLFLRQIQGTAGTTDDQIKYSWNYAVLLAEGPQPKALVPSPIYTGMKRGATVRFEEITRCQPEIQDSLVSILSEKILHVPELSGDDAVLFGAQGFNLIATANLRDRGVHEMSSALKRRFNFEMVHPIADRALELRLVTEQTEKLLRDSDLEEACPPDVMELLVSTFHDLRTGRTDDGVVIERPSTVMSTAEAVAVGYSAGLDAHYFGSGKMEGANVARQLAGTLVKDNPDDIKKIRHYFDAVVKLRAKNNKAWQSCWESRKHIGL